MATLKKGQAEPNDPKRAGKRASRLEFFSDYRFCVYALHTPFAEVEWLATDARAITDAEVRAGVKPPVVIAKKTRAEVIRAIHVLEGGKERYK